MYLARKLKTGTEAVVITPRTVEARLSGTCFRGPEYRNAGNFSRWHSAREMFADPAVLKEVLAEINELWDEGSLGTFSVSFTHPESVGWESTAPIENYALADLEPFKLNKRSNALRIKPSLIHIRAPRTNEVTVIFDLKSEDGAPIALIRSIYPGKDVGVLEGDVSAREERIFFTWEHPGE